MQPACATVFHNSARLLQAVTGLLLPGRLQSVANQGALDPVPALPLVAGTTALLRALEPEIRDWSVAIGMGRLQRLAEAWWPGITVPVAFYQTLAALDDGRRGDILRALQRMQLAGLAPAVVAARVAHGLRPWLPGNTAEILLASEQAVLLLGVSVALHAALRTPSVDPSRGAAGNALARLVVVLRTALAVLGGLQQWVDAAPAPQVPRLRHVPAIAPIKTTAAPLPAGPGAGVAQAFPGTFLLQHPFAVETMPAGAPTAWPLPGALARRGRARGRAGAMSGAKPANPTRVQVGRGSSGLRIRASPGRLTAPAHSEDSGHSPARSGVVQKDALMHPMPRTRKGAGKPGKGADTDGVMVRRATERNPTKPSAQAGEDPPAVRTVPSPGSTTVTTPATTTAAWPPPTQLPPPLPPSPPPACLHFHDSGEAALQVLRMRTQPDLVPFCVKDLALHVFEHVFRVDVLPGAAGETIVPYVVDQILAPDMRKAAMRKFSGLGQISRAAPRTAVPLGHDHLCSVLTLTVAPDAQLQQLDVADADILPRNSFRFVSLEQVDGTARTLLAYFIDQGDGPRGMYAMGFIEVAVDPDGYCVTDRVAGTEIRGATLDDMAAGIERLSGRRYRQDALQFPLVGARPVAVESSTAHALFVRREATRASVGGARPRRLDNSLPFFDPVEYSFDGGRLQGRLYRNSFLLAADQLVFADHAGHVGRLALTALPASPSVLRIDAPMEQSGCEAQFMRDHDLQAGVDYSRTTLAGMLEQQSLAQMPRMASALQAADTAHSGGSLPVAPGSASALPRSIYHFEPDGLHYTSHTGSPGVLALDAVPGRPHQHVLGRQHDPMATEMIIMLDLHPHTPYTRDALVWRLQDLGYVLHRAAS